MSLTKPVGKWPGYVSILLTIVIGVSSFYLLVNASSVFAASQKQIQTPIQIVADNDDGSDYDGSWLTNGWSTTDSEPYHIFGKKSWSDDFDVAYCFQNVTVPQNATIESAVLKWHIYSYDGSNWQMNIKGIAQDSALPFSGSDLPSSRPTTVAEQSWTISNVTIGQWATSPELSPIIQEIIDRPGWVSGNALGLYVENTAEAGFLYLSDYNRGTSYTPVLEITYSSGSVPTLTPSLTPTPLPAGLTRYPYLQSQTTGSVIIAWKTEHTSDSVVEYGTTTDYGLMASDTVPTTQHTVTLTGLSPDTTYYYRVSSDGVVLAEGDTFHTNRDENNPNFTFTAFGDSGCDCADQYAVADRVALSDPDLILHTGDVDQMDSGD